MTANLSVGLMYLTLAILALAIAIIIFSDKKFKNDKTNKDS